MWVYFAIGILLGILITILGVTRLLSGVLKIDQISSDKDIYRFEVDDLDKMSKKRYILIKVDANADLSRK